MLRQLTDEMLAGDVSELFVLGGDPVFDAPAELDFTKALRAVDFKLALAASANETSQACDWLVPHSHFLESWSDARAYNGVASTVQPLISPLYESLSEVELLALLIEDADSGYAAVRKTWSESLGENEDDARWQKALANGVIEDTKTKITTLSFNRVPNGPRSSSQETNGATPTPLNDQNSFEIIIKPDPTIWDGRFANNGWLQELPKPLSHVVWDNTAWIAPSDATRFHLKNGDVIRVEIGERTIEIPIWIVPGHAPACITLFAGYGRSVVGRVGAGTGVKVVSRFGASHGSQTAERKRIAKVVVVGRKQSVVTTQHHQLMEGRDLARAGSLMEYLQQPSNPLFAHPPSPVPDDSFYDDWPYKQSNKWGMTIDLTACVGCSACVIACQAENNIPVVGKEQCDKNRHMHWIRIDTYYEGPPDQPTHTLNQPVPCMQCEHAPCEVVCPVAATNHSDDGLNQMIYNRCVGTRYCSNNCPYKVRRFNFLDYSGEFISDPSLHLLSNPEVTMRSRGVMEKCTYCVQRIEHARIAAQLEDRAIRDGEIKTACQAVCPAQAIRFGDLNDLGSDVRRAHDHPLNYAMLEELGTKPRTTYLAEVFSREAELASPNRSSDSIAEQPTELSDDDEAAS
ncbi:hypothetical protein GCM10023156_58730 [Novipirellula rosea]|uniref:4Fe-4S ferredoxin-type domain-containing protein n=2 Tax=Novipirellula rosea TaxID=1031540 RepID=A0ABP8NIS7_9BACT